MSETNTSEAKSHIRNFKEAFERLAINQIKRLELTAEEGRNVADTLTVARAAIGVGIAGSLASGNWELAACGLTVGAITDILDGKFIKATGAKTDEGWYRDFWADLTMWANLAFFFVLKANGK